MGQVLHKEIRHAEDFQTSPMRSPTITIYLTRETDTTPSRMGRPPRWQTGPNHAPGRSKQRSLL